MARHSAFGSRPTRLSSMLARPFEDSLMDSSNHLTCTERWAMIIEERERVEACLASGVTAGDSTEGQSSEEPLDTYTTAHGGSNNANEASVARTHELLSSVNVVHTPTSVRFKSGVTTEATSNSTGLDGVTSLDEIVPALCAVKYTNETSVVGPEDADVALKVVNTAPSVRCEIGANAELSRQRSSEALNKSQQPNMSVACAFDIAKKDSAGDPEMENQDGKKINPVPSVHIKADVHVESREKSVVTLDETYISVARVLATKGNDATEDTRSDFYEHPANSIGLEDYARELAFLSDFTEEINTTIDYNAPNVADPQLSTDRRESLIATLKNHEHILIASGNALPPQAYGAVCDIDTQGHAPIKQRSRRVPLRFLGKLYELLRALLRAGLIVFFRQSMGIADRDCDEKKAGHPALHRLQDERQLWAAQTEAAAAVRSVAPEIMARENAEAFLKAANAKVEALRKDVKILPSVKNCHARKCSGHHGATFKDLNRLYCEVQARDAFIATLNKKLARGREVYSPLPRLRTIHKLFLQLWQRLLIKWSMGSPTSAFDQWYASDDELDDFDEAKAPIPTGKATAGLGDAPPADTSTPKSARRSLLGPKAWKQAAQKNRQKTRLCSPVMSPRRHMKTRSKSVPSSPSSWSPPPTPASSSNPAVVDLSGDQSDVDMVDVGSKGVPSAQDTATESSGKNVGPWDHDDVSGLPDLTYVPLKEALREAEQMRLMFGSSDEGEESDNTVPQGKAASSSAATSKTVKVS
ncbi:hypothetical protein PInf_004694 [Phytophthora infestans]|nr:hypothetical protein PInf_004694 [Phytophthora infestans]